MSKTEFQLQDLNREYKLILCNPDKSKITVLNDLTSLNYKGSYGDFNSLDFSVPYYKSGVIKSKNKNFDLIKESYLILCQTKVNDVIKRQEYFKIISPKKDAENGTYLKNITCQSTAFTTFNSKVLRGYKNKGSQLIYDSVGTNGILNVLLTGLYNTWTVSYMNPRFNNVYHLFEFDKSTYVDVIRKVEADCNCKIMFNTFNNTIQIYDPDEVGIETDIVLNDYNYIKSLSIEPDLSNLKNRIYVYGKNNTDISRYNPLGLYVENYDYFINNGMSTSLSNAWTTYKNKINTLTPSFTSYVDQLDVLTASLNTKKQELKNLKDQLVVIQQNMDGEKRKANTYTNTPEYNTYRVQEQNKLAEINSKQSEINSVQSQIDGVNVNINSIRNQLTYESNFTQAQLQELVENFINEDTKEISSVSDPKLLYEYAKQYLDFKSQIPITFSIDSIDIFGIKESQRLWDRIQVGNKIKIHCPELGYNYYSIRLIELTHNPIDRSLKLSFSNLNELNSIESKLQKIFIKIDSVSDTVTVNKDDYASYSNDKDSLLKQGDVIDTSTTFIKSGDNVINHRGFLGEDLESGGALQYTGDKIIGTFNNWLDYYTLLSGKGLHLQTSDGEHRIYITADYGFQIDKKVLDPQTNEYVWDNVVYLDNLGRFTIDGGWIRLLTENNLNQILIDPQHGIYVAKNIETDPNQPENWRPIFSLNANDGNIELFNSIITIGDDTQKIFIDKFGMDTKFIKWFKNMCKNSQFEVFDSSTLSAKHWIGGIVTSDSSFYNTYSLKLTPSETTIQADSAIVNPQFYTGISSNNSTRVSFHKKGGMLQIKVLDVETNTYLTLKDENNNSSTSIIYPYNENWIPESYTISFNHSTTTGFKVEFTNVDSTNNAYIDAVIIEPDYTGKRPSVYSDGVDSVSVKTIADINPIYVQPDEPSYPQNKDIWIDTDDFTEYQDVTKTSNCTLLKSEAGIIFCNGTFDVNLPILNSSDINSLHYIFINEGTGTITINGNGKNINGNASYSFSSQYNILNIYGNYQKGWYGKE